MQRRLFETTLASLCQATENDHNDMSHSGHGHGNAASPSSTSGKAGVPNMMESGPPRSDMLPQVKRPAISMAHAALKSEEGEECTSSLFSKPEALDIIDQAERRELQNTLPAEFLALSTDAGTTLVLDSELAHPNADHFDLSNRCSGIEVVSVSHFTLTGKCWPEFATHSKCAQGVCVSWGKSFGRRLSEHSHSDRSLGARLYRGSSSLLAGRRSRSVCWTCLL